MSKISEKANSQRGSPSCKCEALNLYKNVGEPEAKINSSTISREINIEGGERGDCMQECEDVKFHVARSTTFAGYQKRA